MTGTRALRKQALKAGKKISLHTAKQQEEAHAALTQLVFLGRLEGKRVGPICEELAAEMRAVHPEWNRAERRAFVDSFRRNGRSPKFRPIHQGRVTK